MRLKKFTEKNLVRDEACPQGLTFVLPLIEAKKDVALALYKARHWSWLWWAAFNGYDLSSLGPKQRAAIIANADFADCDCTDCRRTRRHIEAMPAKSEAKK